MPKEKRICKPKKAPKHHNMKQKVSVVINNGGGKGNRVRTVVKQVPVYISTGPSQSSFAYIPMYTNHQQGAERLDRLDAKHPVPHLSDEVKKTTLADNVKVPVKMEVSKHHETPVANDLMKEEKIHSLAASSLQREVRHLSSGLSNSSPPSWLLRSGVYSFSSEDGDPFGDDSKQAQAPLQGVGPSPHSAGNLHLLDNMAKSPHVTPMLAEKPMLSEKFSPLEKLVYDFRDGQYKVKNPDSKKWVKEDGPTGKAVKLKYEIRRRELARMGRIDLIK